MAQARPRMADGGPMRKACAGRRRDRRATSGCATPGSRRQKYADDRRRNRVQVGHRGRSSQQSRREAAPRRYSRGSSGFRRREDRPFYVEPLFTRDPASVTEAQILMAMMAIKGIYAKSDLVFVAAQDLLPALTGMRS